jgi:nitrite reductase/ring-hydroxylating ferredoxin subunit
VSTKSKPAAPSVITVGDSADVPEGGRLIVEVAGTTIGIFRFRDALYAYENSCAHQGGPVCQGRLVHRVEEILAEDKTSNGMRFDEDELHIVCPWHGAEYNIETGKHPAQPAFQLRGFPISESNGVISVQL